MRVKEAKGFGERYVITDEGKVYSLKYGNEVKQNVDIFGYHFVNLFVGNDKHKCVKVHRLVAEAFLPNPNNYPQVNHINGDKHDNRSENLEWCTPAQNVEHAVQHNLRTHYRKRRLTRDVVEQIRREYKAGDRNFSTAALARKYGTSPTNISLIVRGKIWRAIE